MMCGTVLHCKPSPPLLQASKIVSNDAHSQKQHSFSSSTSTSSSSKSVSSRSTTTARTVVMLTLLRDIVDDDNSPAGDRYHTSSSTSSSLPKPLLLSSSFPCNHLNKNSKHLGRVFFIKRSTTTSERTYSSARRSIHLPLFSLSIDQP